MQILWADLARLAVATCLGGLMGLEGEAKHGPAGLRTSLFICVGAAMFTMLSDQLAGHYGGVHTRMASQIIPGIGFIGAGSIIHARADLGTGITSAATIFVVASIGMTVGGGYFVMAIVATGLVLGVLSLLALIERFLNLKLMVRRYEGIGTRAEAGLQNVNGLLEPLHSIMQNVQIAPTLEHVRVRFECEDARKKQAQVLKLLRDSGVFQSVAALGPVQTE
jgi:putative Mg2+ transporter-C (MgtC) family protein